MILSLQNLAYYCGIVYLVIVTIQRTAGSNKEPWRGAGNRGRLSVPVEKKPEILTLTSGSAVKILPDARQRREDIGVV
jgi:hypothetical protein